MPASDDGERAQAAPGHTSGMTSPSLPVPASEAVSLVRRGGRIRLPSRWFVGAVVAIAGMQLMATMDSTIAIVTLPKIQEDLGLSDAGRSWVITAYVLTFGGLILLGGRLGDTIGRKRTFIVGVALFTIASVLCGISWNDATLVTARLLQGVGAAIASPTGLALIATTFPKGQSRNVATAVFGAMTGVGSVMGLVVGGALAEWSWRLAFLVNLPIGILMLFLAHTTLKETHRERLKLDAAGALVATLGCTAAVYAFSMGPEKGWVSVVTLGSAAVALVCLVAFVFVERNADNPVVPFALLRDPNRLATFTAIFLAGGVMFTVSVLIAVYVQDIMGYSALRAGIGFVPFAIAMGIGLGVSSQLVRMLQPRIIVLAGGSLVLGAMLYGTTLNGSSPYFPDFIVPVVIAGAGIGMIVVPLTVSAIAGVGFDQIGPVSAIALMLQNLGGPLVLAVIQAVITSRTLYLGGTTGPVKNMNSAQLHALDRGYTYGLLWVAAVALGVGAAALFIRYTADQVARAQDVKEAMDAGEIA